LVCGGDVGEQSDRKQQRRQRDYLYAHRNLGDILNLFWKLKWEIH
jgi:hypothetical protein